MERLRHCGVAQDCEEQENSDPERLHGILSGKGYDSAEPYHERAEFNTRPWNSWVWIEKTKEMLDIRAGAM
ncbi:hypothetical protein [Rhizobium sp. AC27/96]|nr:hypothetical protein [Rhizobium sp. AC27/96]